MRAARSVPVNGVAKGILPAGLRDSSSPRPAPVRRLSIKSASEGSSAIHLAFRFRGGLAKVCTLASAKSPSLARSRHATRIRSARASSWTELRNPEPADAEGEDCERTIFRDITARLAMQPGGETPDDRFKACLDRSAGPRDLGYQGRQRTPVLGLDEAAPGPGSAPRKPRPTRGP